jgi:hypothetical protein
MTSLVVKCKTGYTCFDEVLAVRFHQYDSIVNIDFKDTNDVHAELLNIFSMGTNPRLPLLMNVKTKGYERLYKLEITPHSMWLDEIKNESDSDRELKIYTQFKVMKCEIQYIKEVQ